MKIVFTGGGTGGHLFPIIAIAREIRKRKPLIEMHFIGPKDEVTDVFLEKEEIIVKKIISGKLRRYLSLNSLIKNFLDLFLRTPWGIIQAFFYLFFVSPDLVFSKGGHGAFSTIVATKILQIPLFIHESDIVPGEVNKKSFSYALEAFISFNKTEFIPPEKMILTGNPVRKYLLENIDLGLLKEKIGLDKKKPVVLVLGGSQGSERINDLTLSILPHLLPDFQIIHQAGSRSFKKINVQTEFLVKKENKKNYYLFSFLSEEQLKYAYAASDLVVSRAGSGSIFEIACFAKPSILIPLPESAQNHQLKNAYSYGETGAALIVEEKNITDHLFTQKILSLFSNPSSMKQMSEKAKEFSRPRAAEIIAEYIIEFLK
jgi:UDP-N-acetylglucosamine--N-acetylmuramyl-(pentapeptide) pyrophosphoryl-undecaprenol N-acetylglucosamine transferase